MRDIARLAGVSQTTVSFVLNDNPNISVQESTRQAVFDSAAELGYEQARRKRRKSAIRTIGFLIDEVASSSLVAELFEGATDFANQYGCQLPVVITRGSQAAEEAALEAWRNTDLVGVVYSTIVTRPVTPGDKFRDINTVLLNCHAKTSDFISVLPGETLGGLRATTRLVEAECRDIIHITGESWLEATQKRIDGFYTGLATANIPADEGRVYCSTFSIQGGYDNLNAILSERDCPDGIFCGNDWIAQGVYQALVEHGHRPGLDVKIIGYDNLFFSEYMAPPLTTINLPYRDMAQLAIELLLDAESQSSTGPRQVKLPCNLVPRESA
ncbi:LacI family DNA-binding transcriptional regulator [Rhodophyticola sp. CCM32]|uniref:LacI family DNA-binding transcriptional regulator n=1 Tax=Rhodophyticola sp. CCM32 TaxID=2916397 RepID=UPI00236863E7|nr:LacI family DNA-binding transcriptional regulator [Rhodophyticola sp. CCM32]